MPTNQDPKRVFDGFTSLQGGVDSRSDPSLLDRTQCAFIGNSSLRGDIWHTRPPYRNKLLGFENSTTESNFAGLFQGACFYEANDESENSIITSIAGRLFRIYLNSGISTGTGAWTNTGALTTVRERHTATLLQSGKVLVAGGLVTGGWPVGGVTNTCELYDPATGAWSSTGSLTHSRENHSATLLANGKVLVVGGDYSGVGQDTSLSELYDPVAGTWSDTGSALAGLYFKYHTATLLSNGNVLFAGGLVGLNTMQVICALYNPTTNVWAYTGSLHVARGYHTATRLSSGKVLVASGAGTGVETATAELYDPVAGTWAYTGSLNTARYQSSAVLLPNGKVLVLAGYETTLTYLASAELYDPVAGTWAYTGSLNTARDNHTATLLNSNRVLVAGGENSGGTLSSTEFYDLDTGTWISTGTLNVARTLHTATLLLSGKVLVVGGVNLVVGYLSSAELFTPNYYSTLVKDITPSVSELVTSDFTVPTIAAGGQMGTVTGAGFTVPTTPNSGIGVNVTIPVVSSVNFATGYWITIDSGSYNVVSTSTGNIEATYYGSAAHATVSSGVAITFVGTFNINVTNESTFAVNQNIIIDYGSYTIDALLADQLTLTYNGGAANSNWLVADGTVIYDSTGTSQIVATPAELVTAQFTVPAGGLTVDCDVTHEQPFTLAETLHIDSGIYTVTTIAAKKLTLTYTSGAAHGTVAANTAILNSSDIPIVASISEVTTADFVVPVLKANVSVAVSFQGGFTATQQLVIDGDTYVVASLPSGQDIIVVTYTGGVAHVLADTGILDSSGNQIYFIDPNPDDADMVFLYQAENYVIGLCENQGTLIFDGSNSRRADQSQQELASSYVGVYAWGRNWLAQVNGHRFVASDLVGDPSGTPQLVYVDAILKLTENNLLNGGGAFSTPANLGMITAMSALSQLDSSLGIGPVLVGTENSIFSVQAPVDRTTWQNIRYPIQSVALQGAGPVGPRQMITVNSDAWFRSLDGVRSLMAARRDFQSNQSNTPNSLEMSPVFDDDDEDLLYYGSLAIFDNRILITTSPYRTSYGIAHRGLAVINQDAISSMSKQNPPIWEGLWTGLNILQILTGKVNGVNHCYAFVLNDSNGIDLWELLAEGQDETYDVYDSITSGVESLARTSIESSMNTRAMDFGDQFQLKKLIMAELYLDEIVDDVTVAVYFKPDQYPLWTLWKEIEICANVSQCTISQDCTVWQTQFNQYGARIRLPRPPETCNSITNQPMDRGYEFQFRFEITGSCGMPKFKVHALIEQDAMEGECPPSVVCKTLSGCKKSWFGYDSY